MANYQLPFKVRRYLLYPASFLSVDTLTNLQLDNPGLLHFDSFVGNTWVQSKKGDRFEVLGKLLPEEYHPRSNG